MQNGILRKIKDNTELIDREIEKYLSFDGRAYQVLIESMQYSAYSGGKRIRPFLALEFCRLLGGKDEAVLPYAAAIELIHTYSLIHDDLPCMDNDVLRRGKPTNHVRYGEATAMLAGDALLTYAFSAAASNKVCGASQNIEAVKLLSENAGFDGMIGGQMLDLMGEKEKLSHGDFILMNRLKTGCLIKTACLLGCIAAGYSKDTEEYKAAEIYAEKVGLAFQIEDDILDFGTEENKTTFLTFMSVDEARSEVGKLTEEAKKQLAVCGGSETLEDFADWLSARNK